MTINTTVPGHESHRESRREYRGRQAPTTVTVSSQPLAIVRLIGRGEVCAMGYEENRDLQGLLFQCLLRASSHLAGDWRTMVLVATPARISSDAYATVKLGPRASRTLMRRVSIPALSLRLSPAVSVRPELGCDTELLTLGSCCAEHLTHLPQHLVAVESDSQPMRRQAQACFCESAYWRQASHGPGDLRLRDRAAASESSSGPTT
jgi:hypothetical protein